MQLQAILPDKQVASVTLVTQEQLGLRPDSRSSVVDVKCETGDGSTFIIEMQIKGQDDFSDRMVFYSSFPIADGLRKGTGPSYRLTPLYMVGITNYIIAGIPTNSDVVNHYTIRNVKDNGVQFTDSIHYITVELPKLPPTLPEVKDKPEWIFYTIRNIGDMTEMPEEYKGSYLEKIFRLTKFAAMNAREQEEYLARYKRIRDELSGREYEREQGRAEGRVEGRAEGEQIVSRRYINEMIKLGLPTETIEQVTGLSAKEIQNLIQ